MKVRITLIVILSLLLAPSFSMAGNGNRGEVVEQLWYKGEKQWQEAMIKSLNTTDKEFNLFLSFYSDRFLKVRKDFIARGMKGQVCETNALDFFARLTNTYKSLFHKFQKIERDYPNTVKENTEDRAVRPPVIAGACNPACTNLDFSSGNLSGWNAYYAENTLALTSSFGTTAPTGGPAGAVTKAALDPTIGTYQIQMMSGAGVDPYAGALIPVAAPLGGYSARVGDTTVNFGSGILTNQFTVPSVPIPVLTIQYAVVLEHTVFHSYFQQPWFKVEVLDASGKPIPGCGQYFVVAYDTLGYLKDFVAFPHPINSDTMYCRPWRSVFVPLNGYQGQCVTLSFQSSDCNGGAHLGYAYVAATCGQLAITSSSTTFCGQPSITLTAPPGGSYQWIGPCISGSSTNQTVTVTCAGTYSVIVKSSASGGCADTLSIPITTSTGTPPIPSFFTDTVCAGTATKFTNTSNPLTGPGVKFYWDFFNNGKFEDSTTTPTWTFTQGGVYYVRLHETNNGCGSDTTIKVVVDTSASVAFSSFAACAGQASSFFISGTPPSKFIWNFGDPSSGANDTSTQSFATHIFASAGTYTVSLSTLGVHCADSSTQVVTVGASPTASALIFQKTCADSTITFKDADSTNIAEYEWEFFNSAGSFIGFNFSTSSATTTYTFPGPGTYTIVLYAFSNPSFCEGVDTVHITIGASPTAAFNILPSDSVCIHKPASFTDASTGGPASWKWDFGDPASGPNNTSNKQNPTHTYATPGNYVVKEIVNPGSGCSDSITHTVAVTEVAGNFNMNVVCLHDTTKFIDASTVTNGNIKSWQWNFGDGGTSALQSPTHVYAVAGTYNVTLTVTTTTGCDSIIVKKVTVAPGPSPFFKYSKACLGQTTKFTDLSTAPGGSITGWSWSFGDGGTSVMQNPSHTYGAVGTYNTILVVQTNSGCSDSVKEIVYVNPLPAVAFSADTLSGCAPLCVKFTDASAISSGKNTNWSWNFGAGGKADTASGTPATYCYNSPGTFNVTLKVTSDSGCSSTTTINKMITAYAHPLAAFTTSTQEVNILDPVVSFVNQSTAPNDVIIGNWWLFKDDNSTSTLQNPTHTYPDTGTYCADLKVKNSHGCVDSTENCIIVEPVFTFYIPNAFSPNNNGLNDFFGPEGKYVKIFDMYIFDRWGNLLYHTSDMLKPWDGTYGGVKAQEDTYVYLIKVTDTQNKQHSYLGKVTLLR